jgi:hypothetical protein
VLERRCEGLEQRGERDGDRRLLTVLGRAAEGKKREAGGSEGGRRVEGGT